MKKIMIPTTYKPYEIPEYKGYELPNKVVEYIEYLEKQESSKLLRIINEAIEYIEEYEETLKEHNGDWLNYRDGFKPYLLKILKGEENE